MHPSFIRGMTLIEMLVVLLMMSLLVSVTVLSTGMLGRDDSSASGVALRVAEDLSRLFEQASRQAVAKNEVLGWSLQDDRQMHWWRWASPPSAQAPVWLQADGSVMTVMSLPDNIALQVNADASSDRRPEGNLPVVVFFPGREYSAFEIVVRSIESARPLARVWTERDGLFKWGVL